MEFIRPSYISKPVESGETNKEALLFGSLKDVAEVFPELKVTVYDDGKITYRQSGSMIQGVGQWFEYQGFGNVLVADIVLEIPKENNREVRYYFLIDRETKLVEVFEDESALLEVRKRLKK